ncbi:hypothetical protein ACIA74_43285 [Streptomyces sp. NPDC051658]|uniref:hypothetical protein n=1 Tax=Streptomyces sp. NPDC051658 TaxID=3365667 RepID=UPI003791E29F
MTELQQFLGKSKGETVQRAGAAIDRQATVADVEIVEQEAAHGARSCGVNCGKCEDQPVGRVDDGGNGPTGVLGFQGLDDTFFALADAAASCEASLAPHRAGGPGDGPRPARGCHRRQPYLPAIV